MGEFDGEFEVVASAARQETRLSITQETSKIASLTVEPSEGLRAWIHHPRDTTTRYKQSLPPSSKRPQSFPVVSSFTNGHSLVSRHSGWAADHHCIHLSSKHVIEAICGTVFFPNGRPFLNHGANSSGRGSVGSLNDLYDSRQW